MRDYKTKADRISRNVPPGLWEKPSPYWKGGGKPRYFQSDFETYGEVDLGACGSYRYILDDTFEPLMLAGAFDDEEVFMVDLAMGEEIPDEVWAAIFDPDIIKTAWNAQFERTVFGKMAGRILSPDSWRCSMVWAASLSLPLALKNSALVLKTGEQKDKEGERLIRYFSIPCKPTKANGGRTRNLPEHAQEDWELFKSYCLQDVRTERDIRKTLERFPLQDSEWDYYHMDQRINDRGVLIDKELVTQAITCDLMLSEEMTRKAYELTGLENPNSVQQLKTWLEERGIEAPSLGKKEVAAMIDNLEKNSPDGEALEMLKLRLQMAKSSVKKYQAADRYTCQDGRARGLFQFSGANRTQRWCLTGDHEVLTQEGWVRLDEWTGGKIACWNAPGEIVSFQQAKALCFPYNGPMYTYRDVRIDQCSTPDHKMHVMKRRGSPWTDMTVEEMASYRPLIPMFGYRHMVGSPNTDWLRVMVMTQADGSFTADRQLSFHFRKARKVERCKHLLRRAGIAFIAREYKYDTCIVIPARSLPLWLREFRDKTFGPWLLDENADVFFEELPYWDGSKLTDNSIQYVTVNKQNADLVQALAHISGRTATMLIKNQSKVNEKWNDAYVLNIWNNATNQHEISCKPEITEYQGNVYCAETGTGYFLVRRNGRVWVTGNSGRGVQLQNLYRNEISTLDEARELVKMGCFDMVESIYGNTPDILSQLIRTMLVPKEGHEFIVADFSAIEARVLAWLAGEQWRLDAFRNGADIYCASASQMFGVPVVKHGINGELRSKGKVAELACIAEGQLVHTDHGEIPIEKVTAKMRVWDGTSYVSHGGVVYRGEKHTIRYANLIATPDHPVLLGDDYIPFYEVAGDKAVDAGVKKVYDIYNCGPNHRFMVEGFIVHNCGYGGSSGALINMGALDMGLREAELPDLISDWRNSNPNIVHFWWDLEKAAVETFKDRQERMAGRIGVQYYAGTLWLVLPSGRKLAYIKPRLQANRFGKMAITFEGVGLNNKWVRQETYGGKLTENCLAEGTLVMTRRGLIPIENLMITDLIWDGKEWVRHEGVIDKGLQETVEVVSGSQIGIHMTSQHRILTEEGWLKCGRCNGKNWEVVQGPNGASLSKSVTNRITVHPTGCKERVYDIRNCGPRHRFTVWDPGAGCLRIVSNCTQATARDILAEAMWRLEKAGLAIVGHVHDEVILEVPQGSISVDEVCAIMNENPDWAEGLPLDSAGYHGNYYFKD